jgi:hypothetical protein
MSKSRCYINRPESVLWVENYFKQEVDTAQPPFSVVEAYGNPRVGNGEAKLFLKMFSISI